MKAFILAGLIASQPIASAALSDRALILDVKMEQRQQHKTTARSSDGARDRDLRNVRVLVITYRALGFTTPESATIDWKFIARDPFDGDLTVYSQGEKDLKIGDRQGVYVAESDELSRTTKHTTEGFTRVQTRQGLVPHGWIVRIIQGGRTVKIVESSQGLAKRLK